jgi:glycosyltransferase involved in cell wall biosynthesis
MNIGFDAKRLFQNYTGLGNYSRTLVKNLAKFYPDEHYHLFAPKVIHNETTSYFIDNQSFSIHHPSHKFGTLWRLQGMKSDLLENNIDIYHGLSHDIPLGIKRSKIPTVVTMHDLIFKIYPEYYPTAQRWIYDCKFRYACENSDLIIAISEQTKHDIIQYYSIDEKKIKVAYQTCDDRFQKNVTPEAIEFAKKTHDLPDEYMLYVGSIIDRKNLLRVVQAMTLLPPSLQIPLVVIGDGKEYKQKVIDFVVKNGLKNRVIFIPKVIYQQLPEIYAGSTLFLYPSEYEGFGIPIIEAAFMRTPVITSDCSCLPEAAGKDALLVDPTSIDAIHHAMEKILTDNELRKNIIEKSYQYTVKNFGAKNTTDKVFEIYNTCL